MSFHRAVPADQIPLNQKLKEIVKLYTTALNVASRFAILQLLSSPTDFAFDQQYYQICLSALDSKSRYYSTRKEETGNIKAGILDLIQQYPENTFPGFTFTGHKFLQNRCAENLATATRNSVVYRFLGFQRNKLRDRIKKAQTHLDKKLKLAGKDLEDELNEITFFLKLRTY